MKKILLVAFCLVSLMAAGQCPKVPQYVGSYYNYWGIKDSILFQLPRRAPLTTCRDSGMTYYNPIDSALHWWTGFTDRSFLQHANNGLFDSSYTVQLGEPLGTTGSPDKFYSDRELNFNAHRLLIHDTLNDDTNVVSIWDTTTSFQGVGKVPLKITTGLTAAYYFNWVPWNYNQSYTTAYKGGPIKALDFSFGISPNQNNAGDGSPDNVFGFGYNITGGTARKDTSDGAVNFAVETNYLNSLPGGVQPNFEVHWPRLYRFDGTEQRVNSYYMGKVNGSTLWESNVDVHEYKSRPDGFNYLSIGQFQGSGNGQIVFQNEGSFDFSGRILFSNIVHNNASAILDNSGILTIGKSGTPSLYIDQEGSTHAAVTNNSVDDGGMTVGADSVTQFTLDPSASFEVKSGKKNKGTLLTRLTTAEKLAISSPAEGLIIYDLTLHKLCVFTGTVWETITSL